MFTFLFPPGDSSHASVRALTDEMDRFFRKNMPLPDGMEELYRILKNFFPLDHILVTAATEHQGEERMLVFPDIAGSRRMTLNSTPEQLLALGHGPERVVRLGN